MLNEDIIKYLTVKLRISKRKYPLDGIILRQYYHGIRCLSVRSMDTCHTRTLISLERRISNKNNALEILNSSYIFYMHIVYFYEYNNSTIAVHLLFIILKAKYTQLKLLVLLCVNVVTEISHLYIII